MAYITTPAPRRALSKLAEYRPVMRPNIEQPVIEYDFDHGVLWNTFAALNVIFSSWGWRPGLWGKIKSVTARQNNH